PDRAAMGADAPSRDPQPQLPDLQRILPMRSAFPASGGAEKLGCLLRFGHRQFSRNQPCRFSGSQGVRVYKWNGKTLLTISSGFSFRTRLALCCALAPLDANNFRNTVR